MSSQRGNVSRQRPQKYQNKSAFKNTLHDTSNKTKLINAIQPTGCCDKCKAIIEWKIKYKKYKLLSQPRKCVKCEQKSVKKSYSIVCDGCAKDNGICVKCCHKREIAVPHALSAAEEASQRSQLENDLKFLTERQRRTFHRLQESGKLANLNEDGGKVTKAAAASAAADISDSESSFSDDNLSDNCEASNNDETEPAATEASSSLDQSLPEAKIQNLSLKQLIDHEPCSSTSS